MKEMQMLFPIEPAEFWLKLKLIVDQSIIEHAQSSKVIPRTSDQMIYRPLLKVTDVCAIFKISKPALYDWMNQGRLPSIKIHSRRFFRQEDVDELINQNKSKAIQPQTIASDSSKITGSTNIR